MSREWCSCKLLIFFFKKNYVLASKNIAENIYVEKTYHIRTVGGGGQPEVGLRKKKASVGLFSTFRHPLAFFSYISFNDFILHILVTYTDNGYGNDDDDDNERPMSTFVSFFCHSFISC